MRDEITLTERVRRLENFAGLEPIDQGEDARVTMRHAENLDKVSAMQERDRPALEEVLQQLGCIAEHGEVVAGRLEDLGGRVFGHLPADAAGKAGVSATPEPIIDRLFLTCNRLSVLMNRLEEAQARACRIA